MDWKIILFISQVLVLGGNVATFMVIKFNDLRHLSKEVKELTNEIKSFKKEFKKVSDSVIAIKATCNETHKR